MSTQMPTAPVGPRAAAVLPPLANVVAGPTAQVLSAIRDGQVGLALWWRDVCPDAPASLTPLLAGPAFCHEIAGLPDEAAQELAELLPVDLRPIASDAALLARQFATVSGASIVRLRLEHRRVTSCPKLHVDAVGLRLLCTYAGRGTEWQDVHGTVRRMPAGHVGIFKGTRWLDDAPRVPHRSPALSHLPRAQRSRLLLCIDRMELS